LQLLPGEFRLYDDSVELERSHKPMGGRQQKTYRGRRDQIVRRDFLKVAGAIAIGGAASGCAAPGAAGEDGIGASGGYILVDKKKCQGCVSCMLACSLVNEGQASLSLSRIQVIQNSFEKWPDDVTVEQCRQCADPACVTVCPTGAMRADPEFGNVRRVDADRCIGCGSCAKACPYTPARPVLAADENFNGATKSRKCDLCAGARYHWDTSGGGPGGKQACVAVCPVGAIMFTTKLPIQKGDAGYKVNLRKGSWKKLGYPVS